MRFATRYAILASIIILTGWGCASGNHKKIIGTWVIDAEATLASLKNGPMWPQMPEEAKKQMTAEMIAEKLGAISVTFTKATVEMPGMPEQVPYTVKNSEGNTLVISLLAEGQKADLRIEFKGRDTMQFKPIGSTGMSLAMSGIWRRKK